MGKQGIIADVVRRVQERLAVGPPRRIAPGTPTPRIAIIGSGFGGIGMGIQLRRAGIESFTIYEKADRIGGTWRDNTYPGAACDVPSHLYSFSFAANVDWTRKFPEQPEILAYLEDCVDRFDIRDHIQFGADLAEATFDEDAATWRLLFVDGTTIEADVLVAATGQLNRPHVPDIAGLDDFAGHEFHSARWDHDHDLTDRDVAVIGVGASAIQFVPEIAKQARSVTLFQRSSNYVGPKPDGLISDRARALMRRFTVAERAYRASIWVRFDARFAIFKSGSRVGQAFQRRFAKGLEEMVSPELSREALIPDYTIGCKRILISNDWYPTLMEPHVTVVTDPVERVTPGGVVAAGEEHPVDTIIFGTGFQSTGFLAPMQITGRNGVDLHTSWKDGAEATLGITVSGFPNLYVLYGPNTNLGHNSIIFMLERQIRYAIECIEALAEQDLAWLDVKPEVQAAYNDQVQRELAGTVWGDSCHSWYKTESGKITNNWSGTTLRYWRRTVAPRLDDYVRQTRASSADVAERVPTPSG